LVVVVVEAGLRGHQGQVVVSKFEYVLKNKHSSFHPFLYPPFLLLSPLAGRSGRSNRRQFTFSFILFLTTLFFFFHLPL
jgi:hypothetical protein